MGCQLAENSLLNLLRRYYLLPGCHVMPRYRTRKERQNIRAFSSLASRPARSQLASQQILHNFALPPRPELHHDIKVRAQTSHSIDSAVKSNSNTPPKEIAILGGGVTGLASALYLSKELPEASITLYEASERLGGWVRTKYMDVGNGSVVFEQGPRSLRPQTISGLVTLELVLK